MNFTKRFVETVSPPPGGSVLHWDNGVAGLGLRVWATGRKTFFWSRRANKKLEYVTIGEAGSTSLDDARAQASERNKMLADWKRGGFVGEAPWLVPPSLTLNELIEQYKDRYVDANLRKPQRTRQIIDSQINTHCGALRDRSLSQITRSEIIAVRESAHKGRGPYASNRLIEMLRAAINWAIEMDLWKGTNPAAEIAKFKENSRERFLLPHEFAALKTALDAPETSDDLRDFVRLALYTGARKSDVLGMAWKDVDLERAVWLVPIPKSGTPYYIPLVPAAKTILEARLKRAAKDGSEPSGWAFPNPESSTGHLLDLKKGWAKLLEAAGIENLWIHDLRRSLGSVMVEGGTSLHIVGKALGHQNTSSTQVYARLQLEAVRKSVEAATATMVADMERKPKPALLPKPKRKAGRNA